MRSGPQNVSPNVTVWASFGCSKTSNCLPCTMMRGKCVEGPTMLRKSHDVCTKGESRVNDKVPGTAGSGGSLDVAIVKGTEGGQTGGAVTFVTGVGGGTMWGVGARWGGWRYSSNVTLVVGGGGRGFGGGFGGGGVGFGGGVLLWGGVGGVEGGGNATLNRRGCFCWWCRLCSSSRTCSITARAGGSLWSSSSSIRGEAVDSMGPDNRAF